jgi:glycosyltransferase involved in cell wall biosynthesis
VLAPSPSSQKQLEDIGLKNVGVFGRGVDHVLFNPVRKDKEILLKYGLNPNAVTLGYVGRLAEEKSLPELASAFEELSSKYEIQLLIVGDGPIRTELEKRLDKADGHYAFAGLKKGEELADLYAAMDIFAFPSKTETFGQVVLEAMASGVPVVGYDSPGVRDLVQNTKSGLLAKSLIEFRLDLELLIRDAKIREMQSKKARELALDRSWDAILNGLISEYGKLTSR